MWERSAQLLFPRLQQHLVPVTSRRRWEWTWMLMLATHCGSVRLAAPLQTGETCTTRDDCRSDGVLRNSPVMSFKVKSADVQPFEFPVIIKQHFTDCPRFSLKPTLQTKMWIKAKLRLGSQGNGDRVKESRGVHGATEPPCTREPSNYNYNCQCLCACVCVFFLWIRSSFSLSSSEPGEQTEQPSVAGKWSLSQRRGGLSVCVCLWAECVFCIKISCNETEGGDSGCWLAGSSVASVGFSPFTFCLWDLNVRALSVSLSTASW